MQIIGGYNYLREIEETNVSQVILVEKNGIKYVLKNSLLKDYNYLIDREYIFLKYLQDLGITPKLFSIGKIGNRTYLVREYLEGSMLKDFLKDKSSWEITEYFRKVLYLMFKLHTHGIVLRDISPTNFFIRNDNLYIIDLGMATHCTEKPSLEGTPSYLAPESIADESFSFKSDLYSVGVMFYEFYKKRPAYKFSNLDDLFIQQSQGLPPFDGIPQKPAKLLKRVLSFEPENRPTTLDSIKILDGSPLLEHLVVDKSFPIIFSREMGRIINRIKKTEAKVLNIFSARYPEGFFSVIFKELSLRLELEGFKTSLNSFEPSKDIILLDYEHLGAIKNSVHRLNQHQRVIIFSLKPLNIGNINIDYMNLSITNLGTYEQVEEVISISTKIDNSGSIIPSYAQYNLSILAYIIPEDFPREKNLLKTISRYLNAEYNDLIDILSSFRLAVPKSIIYYTLIKNKSDKHAKIKERTYFSILSFMDHFGFIDIKENHIILLPAFHSFVRSKNMKHKANIDVSNNIYDHLEYLLQNTSKIEHITTKLKELLKGNKIPPTHASIFLDALYDAVESPSLKIDVIKAEISLGLLSNVRKKWQELLTVVLQDAKKITFDYIRLSISLGIFHQTVEFLREREDPQSKTLLLYAYALYSKFDLFLDILKNNKVDRENPYYHLAMGFYQMAYNKKPNLAKQYAITASELSHEDPHVIMVSTYIYGTSVLETGQVEKGKNILESINTQENYGIESLLVNFQLGYIYYSSKEFLKAIYYFEYSYHMAKEFHSISLSVQAAFYLSHIYYHMNKLDVAEYYMDYAYKYQGLLTKEQKDYLLKNYADLAIYLKKHDKIKALTELMKKNPGIEGLLNPITLANIYYLAGEKEKLKTLLHRIKNEEENILVKTFLEMIEKTENNKEVQHG